MSRLDELIAELCPNGVEYKTLGDVAVYGKERINASKVNENNYVGVDNLLPDKQGKTESSYVPKEGSLIKYQKGDLLIGNIRPYLKKIWLASDEGGTNGDVLVVHVVSDNIEPKFLYYCISSDKFFIYDMQHAKGAKMPRGDKVAVMQYKIPVPPLEVQREIVRVLDEYTQKADALKAELTAELKARKQQYEYYSQKLLEGYKKESKRVPLSALGKWQGGKTPPMQENRFWENGTIPWISSKDMKSPVLSDTQDHITNLAITEASMNLLPEESVVIVTRSGILKHTFPVAYIPFKTTINQDIKALTVADGVSARYISFVLQAYGDDIRTKTKKQGGTVDSLDFKKVLNYEIPLPDYDVQRRIVNVLDNFESICSDLNIDLPAEIEARNKQYEYYRNLLLTFVETGETIALQSSRAPELQSSRAPELQSSRGDN